ncbi:MAG TPA: HAMP domain-containing sensor histidine kinase [Elusimicrobiota bacterium]|jgi:signal transduction histidine kinase|nr:HAMP domain-containing sensor histidine kinase [Elusimicrobiota bacterium]
MTLSLLALCASLCGTIARATESESPRYSNVSLNGAATVAPAPAPKRAAARKPDAPPLPPPRAPAPVPAPPSTPVWPWTALGAAAVFGGAVLARFRAAKRERAAGESLALAAHELKSPLSAIESYLDLMVMDAPEGARGARLWLEDARRMKSTASHLRRTIGDILDMTRIEDGRLKLSPRRVPLAPLLAEVAAEYGALARGRGVSVAVDAPPGLPDAAADPDRLRQVLHNLLGNALKFTPAGRGVRLSAASDNAGLIIRVCDEGVGVPHGKRGKLFGKFSRLAPALDETEGTGLGLYISRRLVEAQGGRLTYEPGPEGQGSVFRVALPRAEEAA